MISVVTICYNARADLQKTMQSVSEQSCPKFEYVIQDGNSTDGTQEMVARLAPSLFPDNNLQYVQQRDAGIYDAMNKAVENCHGEWIVFLNAGDVFPENETLKAIDQFLQDHKDCDVVYGNAIIDDNGEKCLWEANLSLIQQKMPFCHQACLMRKSLLQQLRFDTDYRIAADYDLVLRAYRQGARFVFFDQSMAVFELSGVSSTQYEARVKEQVRVRIRNGCVPESYLKSMNYKQRLLEAKVKKLLDQTISNTPFYKGLRNLYKKYFKHYKKIH